MTKVMGKWAIEEGNKKNSKQEPGRIYLFITRHAFVHQCSV